MTLVMLFTVQDVRRGTVFQDKEPEETWAFEDGVNKSKRPTAYLLTQQVHLYSVLFFLGPADSIEICETIRLQHSDGWHLLIMLTYLCSLPSWCYSSKCSIFHLLLFTDWIEHTLENFDVFI